MVEPAHPGSSHRLGTGACIFSRIILGFNGIMLSVVGDVPVDSEASVVTSSISRFAGPTQFYRGAHRGRVYVRAFIWVSVRSCM